MAIHNVIIIWSGPAWHTASIYAARANLKPLMFEWFLAWGVAAGWQLTTTTDVENFPWFPDGIDGTELMNLMRQQSLNAGTHIVTETIEKVDLNRELYDGNLMVRSQTWIEYITKTLIIATGATAKKLDVLWVEQYRNKWISGCAVCDWALPFFRNMHLVVVWWWDVAMEEAIHLSKFGSQITIIVRTDTLRASKIMIERAQSNPKIQFLYWTEIQEVYGNDKLIQGIKIKNNQSGMLTDLSCWGLFFAIGHVPNTHFLVWQLVLDDIWYIITLPWSTQTSIPWVYAAGDVQDKKYRQAVTSAGTGCMAALEAEHRLNNETAQT